MRQHLVDDVRAVGRDPQARRTDRGDRRDPLLPGLTRHPRDGAIGPLHRLRVQPPGSLEALAQPRDLGAVGERPPAPSARAR